VAQNGRPTLTKRQREAKARKRREDKDERRRIRKAEKVERLDHPSGADSDIDPDIADIIPGPQPPRI
jgi:hypothetical protein